MYKQLSRVKSNTAVTLLLIAGLLAGSNYFHSVKAQSLLVDTASKSSDGTMQGVNLQRTRVYNSKGLTAPKSQSWQTEKLFTLKESISFSGQMGSLSYFGWLPTGFGTSHPILIEGAIYFTLSVENGYLFTLDAATGKEKKTIRIKNVALSPPAIAGELIYLGGSDGSFFAMNRNTGEVKWQIAKKGYAFNVTAPTVADNMLYFGGAQFGVSMNGRPDGTVHALDIDKQQQKWLFKTKGIPTSAAVSGDLILFGDMDKQLFGLDRNTGREKWRFKAAADVKSPAIMGEDVYFPDESGNLYRVELKTGQLQWKSTKVKAQGALALYNGLVIFSGQNNSVYAVDAITGNDKWVFQAANSCGSPVVANGAVYFACSDKTIYSIDALTGEKKWLYKSKNDVLLTPLIGDGVMYFLDNSGYMFAVH